MWLLRCFFGLVIAGLRNLCRFNLWVVGVGGGFGDFVGLGVGLV